MMKHVGKTAIYFLIALALAVVPNWMLISKAVKVTNDITAAQETINRIIEADKLINDRLDQIEVILQIEPKKVLKDKVNDINDIKDKGKVRVPKKIGDFLGN